MLTGILRIGLIGVGGVGRYAHLPAYRRDGLEVVAVCDSNLRLAEEVAAEFGVPVLAETVEGLAACDEVDVLDVATPPSTHIELLSAVIPSGKPVLLQKPACTTAAELTELRDLVADGHVRLNMTGRHVPAWRKVAALLAEGAIGRPYFCTIVNRDWWDREDGRWDHEIEHYIVHEMLIHHLDLCHAWFGPPARVAARAGSHPQQRLQQDNWITATIDYEDGPTVQLVEDWTMPEFAFAHGHPFEEVMIAGEAGVIRGQSERVELSRLGENTIRVWHRPRPGQHLPGEQLAGSWFPDSFAGAMRNFMDAVERGDAASGDREHMLALTADALAVASATESDRWVVLSGAQREPPPSATDVV